MTLEEATKLFKGCVEQMNARYKKTLFDEWAIVSLADRKSRILTYAGPRNDDFLRNFASDLGTLRGELVKDRHGVGDFEFARNGVGTSYEAFLVLGDGLYLICNNTKETMEGIAKDPRWLEAQKPFAEFSDKVRFDPLVHNL